MTEIDPDRQSLESLVVDYPDFEQLEARLAQFNLFEAIGVERVEVRHSDFLSFLMDPAQNHGLGDTVVKHLLQKALVGTTDTSSPVTAIDLDTWDLSEMTVSRESQNIDILLLDDRHQLAVIIENKLGGAEHHQQLQRYWQTVAQNKPGWKTLGIFLSPEGDPPSDPNYLVLDYATVCEALDKIAQTRASIIGPDVRVALSHYIQLLRRHVVTEPDIAELCRRIYRRHQRALDLIYEYRPDQQESIRQFLEGLIQENPELVADHSSKSYIRFGLRQWEVPLLQQGEGWTRTGRLLLFEFRNFENRLAIHLIIGPGPTETRRKLFEFAHNHKPPFNPALRVLGTQYNAILVRPVLAASDYEVDDFTEIETKIRKKWHHFIEQELPEVEALFTAEPWIWEAG